MQDLIRKELSKASDTINAFISSPNSITNIEKAISILSDAFKSGNKTISCGNGGSMCDAMHFAEELSGRFRADRPALPAMAISDPSHITCTANDYGFDSIFSRYVEAFGSKGDVLLAISTSGNSPNVIKAAEAAKFKGMKIIGLTGKDGGRLAGVCDVEIRVPHSEFADRIQEVHIKVIHCLILGVELNLFK
ncbi:MAG: D-sedoheptulose 7-phosphate isomerase [Bacteroidota bacterium]